MNDRGWVLSFQIELIIDFKGPEGFILHAYQVIGNVLKTIIIVTSGFVVHVRAKEKSTYNFSNAKLAYMSTVLSSHCDATYSWKICVVSGLYLSRPLRMASMWSGLSGASSNATPILCWRFVSFGYADVYSRGIGLAVGCGLEYSSQVMLLVSGMKKFVIFKLK